MGKLLPCPFCGEEARESTYQDESLWSHDIVTYLDVGCSDCGISMSGEEHDEVRANWNERAAPSLAAQLAEAAALLRKLSDGWDRMNVRTEIDSLRAKLDAGTQEVKP